MKRQHYPSQLIQTTATIGERIDETAFHAHLPNGKPVVAFVERKNAPLRDLLRLGDRVEVSICPSDFNRARIDARIEQA